VTTLGRGGSDTSAVALAAALVLLVGMAAARRWPLRTGEGLDLRPSQHWREPVLALEPTAEDGPVLVTVEYRVAAPQQAAFCEAMAAVQLIRLRDGATRWEIFRDIADLERFLETFVVDSWAEHLRQHERVTVADRDIEQQALAFQKPGSTPIVAHLIATRSSAGKATEP